MIYISICINFYSISISFHVSAVFVSFNKKKDHHLKFSLSKNFQLCGETDQY